MQRFLYRVQYTLPDATVVYEPVCVLAANDDEASARAEVTTATDRYLAASGGTRTITLVLVTAD